MDVKHESRTSVALVALEPEAPVDRFACFWADRRRPRPLRGAR